MTVLWRWMAFSGPGTHRPVYHAIAQGPRWPKACRGEGTETVVGADGRERCLTCLRTVLAPG